MSTSALEELLAFPGRPTRALVDLDAIHHNVGRLRAVAGETVDLMAVVKADAYGHGAVMVAREALAAGAAWLGVATVAEGQELRGAGIDAAVLILGPIHASEIDDAIASGLDVTVGDEALAAAVLERAGALTAIPRVHLKVDTGMHRYGLSPSDALPWLRQLESVRAGTVVALCSHLASADEPDAAITAAQVRLFHELTAGARSVRADIATHLANSAGTLAGLSPAASIVRTGIAMYGTGVRSEHASEIGLRQALSVVSRLNRVHALDLGDGVSYGLTYRANARERVGLVPVGYADGYPRSLGNRGRMSAQRRTVPVRGRVCMDQTVIGNLSDQAKTGDWVGVAGPALDGPSWDELAELAGTISYELLTAVGRRLRRLYHRAGRMMAVRDEMGRLTEFHEREGAPTTNRR